MKAFQHCLLVLRLRRGDTLLTFLTAIQLAASCVFVIVLLKMFSKPALLGLALASIAAAGPCDLYATGGTPCVAAHSTTRALYSAFTGALYQVKRGSDNTTTTIAPLSAGGVANAAAQDTFCSGTTCKYSCRLCGFPVVLSRCRLVSCRFTFQNMQLELRQQLLDILFTNKKYRPHLGHL